MSLFGIRWMLCLRNKGGTFETHISAQQDKKKKNTWISKPDEYKEWTTGIEPAARQRPQTVDRLIPISKTTVPLDRLRSSRDFREVYRVGQKISGRYCLLFCRSRQDDAIRFGVTATRRLGNAVCRNRAKRLMREAVRHTAPMMMPGIDMVLVARPAILSARFQPVREHLVRQLAQCNRIKKVFAE